MFSGLSNGWQLAKASWAVLQADKELLWFPLMSAIAMILITVTFIIPAGALFGIVGGATLNEDAFNVLGFVALFIYYMINYTVTFYFNTALVGAALIRLDGGDPTVRDGIRIANKHIQSILGYAAISATVGVILRFLQERGGILGNILAGLGGLAWSVATFLVVPVLVTQDVGPIDAVKESGRLLKSTWGEQLSGNFSIGGIFFLLYLALFVVVGGTLFFVAAQLESGLIAGLTIAVLVIGAIVLGLISSALQGIFQAAVYRFAEAGVAPDAFEIDAIRGAFKQKRKR